MKSGQALVVMLGCLAFSPAAGWAGTPEESNGETQRLSQRSKQHLRPSAPCPASAMQRGDDPLLNTIAWNRISSDEEAIGCLRELATDLGPDRTLKWLESNGFNAQFIKQFGKNNPDILLSAGWPIRDAGLLYSPGFLRSLRIRLMAHSQVFSFRWRGLGDLMVGQGYTFE